MKISGKTLSHWGANIPKKDFNLGIGLFRQLISKKINMDEFLKECTYWLLNSGLDDLRPKPLPSEPIEYREYQQEKKHNRRVQMTEGFWKQPVIVSYIAQKERIINHNHTQKNRIKEHLKRLEEYGDVSNADKLRRSLVRY